MIVVPPHDTSEVICVSCRLLCAVIMVDIDEDTEGKDAAYFVCGIIAVDKLRDSSIDLGMISRELLARIFCAEVSVWATRRGVRSRKPLETISKCTFRSFVAFCRTSSYLTYPTG